MSCVEFVLKQTGVSSSQACLPSFPYMVNCKLINRSKTSLTTYLAKCNETQQGKVRTYVFFFLFFFFCCFFFLFCFVLFLFFQNCFQKGEILFIIDNVDIRKV